MIFTNSGKIIFDVSFWQAILRDQNRRLLPPEQQKHIDFNRMKTDAKASAVIVRVGQDFYKDAEFDISWRNAKAAEILRSSYWFCDKDSSPESQARLYWDIIKNDAGEGFISGDAEVGGWTDGDSYYRFFNELQQRSGYPDHKILVYTGHYFWTGSIRWASLAQRRWFTKFPLWLAAYCDPKYAASVKVPAGWGDVASVWQWGTPPLGLLAGAWSKEIDANYFNSESPYTFEQIFGTPPIVTPPVQLTLPYEVRIDNKTYRVVQ